LDIARPRWIQFLPSEFVRSGLDYQGHESGKWGRVKNILNHVCSLVTQRPERGLEKRVGHMFRNFTILAYLFVAITITIRPTTSTAAQPDLDPDALAILKATVGSITGAKTLSFRVRVARDRQATNNQLLTYFNEDVVTISRPDKLRIDVDGEHNAVQFFFDGKKAVLFEPEHKLYVSQAAPSTIDGVIQALDKRGVSFPINDLLRSNPYGSLVDGLQSAYVVGRVNVGKKMFIHLVFTEASADWQLWVEPGDKPVPRGIVIVYKTEPGMPRITMDFLNWNLNAQPQPEMFNFVKPGDAHQIQFFPMKAGK
jgi:hypothetical protein